MLASTGAPLLLKLAGLLLLTSEVFFNSCAMKYQESIIQGTKKASGKWYQKLNPFNRDGSDAGDRWEPLLREGLDADPDKRPPTAFILTSVDEPGSATIPSVLSHLRAAWEYGKGGHLHLAPMSIKGYLFTQKAIDAVMATTREMDVKRTLIQARIKDLLQKHEGKNEEEARVLADRMSIPIASGQTELDDADCMYYAIARVMTIAKDYHIPEKHRVGLGRKIADVFDSVNAENDGYLEVAIDEAWLSKELVALGVDPVKVPVLTRLILAEMNSMVRKSHIAKLYNLILQGKEISATDLDILHTALAEEYGVTKETTAIITASITRNHKVINDAAAEAVGKYNFSPAQGDSAQRGVLHTLRAVVGRLMIYDKRNMVISEALQDKLRAIIQHELYAKKAIYWTPFIGTRMWRNSGRIAQALATEIDSLDSLTSLIENLIIDENLPYHIAEEQAVAQRMEQIEATVERVGQEHGLSEKARSDLAKAVVADFKGNLDVRSMVAQEFANQVVTTINAKINEPGQAAPPTREELLDLVRGDFDLTFGRGSFSLMIDIMIKDNFANDNLSPEAIKGIKTVLESVKNPAEARDELISKLQAECNFSQKAAERFADAYITAYQDTIGKLGEAVAQIDLMLSDGRLKPITADAEARNGATVFIDDTAVDLTAAKTAAETRVQTADISYSWGAKAGVIDNLIIGDSTESYVGEVSRWMVQRLVAERVFGRVQCPPQIVSFIHREIVAKKGLIPLTVSPRDCDAENIGNLLIAKIAEGKVPAEAALEILDEWGLTTASPELINKLAAAGTKIQLGLAMAKVVEEIGAAPNCDVAQVVSALPNLDRAQRKVLADQGKIVQKNIRAGLFMIEGSQGNYRLRLTSKADRDRRVENILYRNYIKTVDGYYDNLIFERTEGSEDIPVSLTYQIDSELMVEYNLQGGREVTAEGFARRVIKETKAGKSTAEIATGISKDWQVSSYQEAEAIETAVTTLVKETRRRMVLGTFVAKAVEATQHNRQAISVNIPDASGTARYRLVAETMDQAKTRGASEEEVTALTKDTEEIRGQLEEIFLKERAEAIGVEHDQTGRIHVVPGENVSIKEGRKAKTDLEDLQYMIIYDQPASAEQIAENIIATSGLPNVTLTREALAMEIRNTAPTLETVFSQVEAEAKTAAAERTSLRTDDAIREVTLAVLEKMTPIFAEKEELDPANKNYLGLAIPQASTIKYVGWLTNDADYRAHPNAMLDQTPHIQEGKNIFMTGQRQFGRERGKAVADAFQSGGHAYWGYTNIRGSQLGIVPSWGSCVMYSARAYRQGSTWVTNLPYEGTLAKAFSEKSFYDGKFMPSKLYDHSTNWLSQRFFDSDLVKDHPYLSLATIVPARAVSYLVRNTVVWLADKHYTASFLGPLGIAAPAVTIPTGLVLLATGSPILGLALMSFGALHARDLLHELASRGLISERLERPLDEEKIIDKGKAKTSEIFAVQDPTTESEDIASSIRYLQSVRDLDQMSRSWSYGTVMGALPHAEELRRTASTLSLAAQLTPMSLWDGLYIEGEGAMGAHSDTLNGANVTFYGRWARGNQPILWPILFNRMGALKKWHFASLSTFWMTGYFRPVLNILPPAFMFTGISSVAMGADPEIFLAGVGLSFIVNFSTFLFSMYARGHLRPMEFLTSAEHRSEALGCLFLEFGGSGKMLKSFDEGTMRGERPGFDASPKEVPAVERQPMRELPFEYAMIGANAAGVAYTAAYAFNLLPGMGGTFEMTAAGFWCLFHLFFGVNALAKFNRGVYTETPYLGTVQKICNHLSANPNQPLSGPRPNFDPNLSEEGSNS